MFAFQTPTVEEKKQNMSDTFDVALQQLPFKQKDRTLLFKHLRIFSKSKNKQIIKFHLSCVPLYQVGQVKHATSIGLLKYRYIS